MTRNACARRTSSPARVKLAWKLRATVGVLLAVLGLWRACDFDSALDSYCAKNPRCGANDAAARPEAGPGPGTDAPADLGANPASGDAGPNGQSNIRPPRSCLSVNDCGPNEICSPTGQVCMTVCQTASDCLPWLDTCDTLPDLSGGSTQKVCMCSASEVCDSFARGFRCNSPDKLCERLCFLDQDCAGFRQPRVCDRLSGVCRSCLSNTNCPFPTQPRCDLVNFRCTGCVSNSDCSGRPDGLSQCSLTGSCVPPF